MHLHCCCGLSALLLCFVFILSVEKTADQLRLISLAGAYLLFLDYSSPQRCTSRGWRASSRLCATRTPPSTCREDSPPVSILCAFFLPCVQMATSGLIFLVVTLIIITDSIVLRTHTTDLNLITSSHPITHFLLYAGMIHSGLSCLVTNGGEPWSLRNDTKDSDRTLPAAECEEIVYPKPDGVLSFDLLTNLQRSGALLVECVFGVMLLLTLRHSLSGRVCCIYILALITADRTNTLHTTYTCQYCQYRHFARPRPARAPEGEGAPQARALR